MRGLARLLATGAVVIAASFAQSGVVAAADASVTPTAARPGEQVTVEGDCGPATVGDNVIVIFRQGTSIFDPIANEDLPTNGLFSLPITIPQVVGGDTVEPGPASFLVDCDVEPPPADVIVPFTVLGDLGSEPPPTPTAGDPAPPTPTAATPAPAVVTAPRFTG
jgi:hypothetical protein